MEILSFPNAYPRGRMVTLPLPIPASAVCVAPLVDDQNISAVIRALGNPGMKFLLPSVKPVVSTGFIFASVSNAVA